MLQQSTVQEIYLQRKYLNDNMPWILTVSEISISFFFRRGGSSYIEEIKCLHKYCKIIYIYISYLKFELYELSTSLHQSCERSNINQAQLLLNCANTSDNTVLDSDLCCIDTL